VNYLRQTLGSSELAGVFDLPLALCDKHVEVIILPVEGCAAELSKQKLQLGFINGPPLPESFYEPLPEEELQLWGL
jgi:hypothetical protein